MNASTTAIVTLRQVTKIYAACDRAFVRQVCVTWVKKTRKVSLVLCAAVEIALWPERANIIFI